MKKSVKWKHLFLALTLTFSFTLMATSSVKAKTIRWRMQHPWPPGSLYDKETKSFVERVKEATGGRLQIAMFAAGSLAGMRESLDAISKGVFEAHMNVPVYWTGKMPVGTFLSGVPGGINNPSDWWAWYYKRDGIDIAHEAYAKFNVRFIAPLMCPSNTPIFTTKKHPVRSLAEFKGLKVRGIPGLQSEILKAVGASPTFINAQDVYTSMETGVVDAVSGFTKVGWYKFGIHEIAKYAIEPAFVLPDICLEFCVGMKAWNKLPDDLKAIFETVAREWSVTFYSLGTVEDAKAYAAMKKAGIEVLTLPQDDMKKIKQMSINAADEFSKRDPLAQKAWSSQKEFLKLIGKFE
jgi:TRAP-type mannitol/chloroaromatic compound transport system substrate-binding protein